VSLNEVKGMKTSEEMQRESDVGTRKREGEYTLTRSLVPIALCLVLFSVAGCSATGGSVDVLFAAANSQLASAKKVGAEQLAESEYQQASRLLAEAEIALKNRDKGARSLIQKAHSKARLAEALARQLRAETEAAQLEAELERALVEASRARLERQSAESELEQGSP